jgi:hypothetical protein
MNRAFSALIGLWGNEPRALPWAGLNDAFGVSNALSFGHISMSFGDLCRSVKGDLLINAGKDLHLFQLLRGVNRWSCTVMLPQEPSRHKYPISLP